ncbi:MAG: hypothetical protein U5P41_13270 [Gammaproteobacteria bacterium]|nr:hypothetical protein [Gammaproteobacteria bacterium]
MVFDKRNLLYLCNKQVLHDHPAVISDAALQLESRYRDPVLNSTVLRLTKIGNAYFIIVA